jgi:hypothetical protein
VLALKYWCDTLRHEPAAQGTGEPQRLASSA